MARRGLFLVAFLHTLQMGMVLPAINEAAIDLYRGEVDMQTHDADEADNIAISSASYFLGVLGVVTNAMLFLANPVAGGLADIKGRKKLILWAILGLTLECLLLCTMRSLFAIGVSAMIRGCTDVFYTMGFVQLTDLFRGGQSLAMQFGKFGAVQGAGLIVGPVMGGLLAKADSSLPFLVASAVGLVNACVWMAVGKETLVAQKPFSWARVSPVLALRHLLTRNKVVTWLSGALLFSVLALSFVPVFVLYAEERFQWGELTIGLTIACFGLLVILTQGFLMKPVVGEWGAEKAIHYSSLAMVGLCLGLGVAWQGWMFWVVLILMSPGLICSPIVRSQISRLVDDPATHGMTQGALTSIVVFAHGVGPVIVVSSFGVFSDNDGGVYMPGAPWYFCAAWQLGVSFCVFKASKYSGEDGNPYFGNLDEREYAALGAETDGGEGLKLVELVGDTHTHTHARDKGGDTASAQPEDGLQLQHVSLQLDEE